MLEWEEVLYANTVYRANSCKSLRDAKIFEIYQNWRIEKVLYQDMIRYEARFYIDKKNNLFKAKFETIEEAQSWCQNLEDAFQKSVNDTPRLCGWPDRIF